MRAVDHPWRRDLARAVCSLTILVAALAAKAPFRANDDGPGVDQVERAGMVLPRCPAPDTRSGSQRIASLNRQRFEDRGQQP